MKKRIFAIVGAGGLATLLSIGAGTSVFAQTPPVTPGQPNHPAMLAAMAKNLGVDPAKLEATMKQTHLDQIDAQVKAGQLTPEQAQQLKDRINQGQMGPGMMGAAGNHATMGGHAGHTMGGGH